MNTIEIYGRFGRVYHRFTIRDNETHHKKMELARAFLLSKERDGVKCWIRLK